MMGEHLECATDATEPVHPRLYSHQYEEHGSESHHLSDPPTAPKHPVGNPAVNFVVHPQSPSPSPGSPARSGCADWAVADGRRGRFGLPTQLARIAKANVAFAVGLMTLFMLVTIVYLPIVLPLPLPGVRGRCTTNRAIASRHTARTASHRAVHQVSIRRCCTDAATRDDDRNRRVGDERAVCSVSPESQCVGERLTVVVVADEDGHRHDGRVAWVTCRVCQAAFNLVTPPFEGRQLALARWPSQLLQPGRPAMWASRRGWW